MNPSHAIHAYLQQDPLIQKCSVRERAQLVSQIEVLSLGVDEVIFTPDQKTDFIYYILEGEVNLYLPDQTGLSLGKGKYFGQEAGFQALSYAGKAVLKTPATLLRIPSAHFEHLLNDHPEVRSDFLFSMLKSLTSLKFFSRPQEEAKKTPKSNGFYSQYQHLMGWSLALVMPLLIYLALANLVPHTSGLIFICLLSSALVMWIFEIVESYIAGLLLIFSALVLGIAPVNVILSGFASETFFMALGILALGSVLVYSGLLYRFLLYILKYLPLTQFWSNASLFFLGLMMTLSIPAAPNRTEVMVPFFNEFTAQTKIHPGSRAGIKLVLSSFFSIHLFSAIFLSGSLHNFMLLGLLWAQDQERFQWWGWLQASLVPGLIILGGFALPLVFFLRSKEKIVIDRSRVEDQLRVLGPFNRCEKFALLSFFLFTFGLVTQDIHRFSPQLIAVSILMILLVFDVLTKERFHDLINWPALFLLGSLIGLIALSNFLGINQFLIEKLDWVGWYIRHDFEMFILILIILLTLLRLVMPYGPAVVSMGALFIPLAQQYEVNPWTVGFIILVIGKMWFYPGQYPPYQEFRNLLDQKGFFNKNVLLFYNLYMNFVRILALYAALPYWRSLGVL